METTPFWSSNDGWRLLHHIADELLSLSDLTRQVVFIQDELSKLTGQPVKLILTEEFKPLPHETIPTEKSAQPVISFIKNIDDDGDFWSGKEDNRLVVRVPLKNPHSTVGYLQIDYPGGTEVDRIPRDFLISFSGYLAKVFELSRLEKLKDWRLEQLSLVRQVNSELVMLRDPHKLYERVVDLIQSTFHFFFVAIYTLDESTNKVIFRSSAGKALDNKQLLELAKPDGIPMGEGLIGRCAESRTEICSADVNQDDGYRQVGGLKEGQSELCLPLAIGDKTLGVLEILSDQKARFHENDILVLRILSDNVALAIQIGGLIDELLEQTWLSTMMLQVSEASQRVESVEDLINEVSRTIPLLIGVQKCGIFLRDERSDEFLLSAQYGFEKNEEAGLAMLPYSEEGNSLFDQLLKNKTILPFVHDLMVKKKNGRNGKNRCCGIIPLAAHGHVFGAMVVDDLGGSKNDDHSVTKGEALLAVGRQTALAIENLRLEESRENEAYVNAILLQVAEMVAATSDLNETVENIISFLPLVVGVDTAFVYLLDESGKRFHLNANLSYHWKTQLNRLLSSIKQTPWNPMTRLMESEKPSFFNIGNRTLEDWTNVRIQDSLDEKSVAEISEPLLMVFPLFIIHDKFGLLYVMESEKGYEYREKKAEIIAGIARHISLAIQGDHLKKEMIDQERVQQEFQLAREIQQTFLPETLPSMNGWEVNASWRPAQQVGGDFYDAFILADERIGLVIADVSDKGFPAALYMTVARTLIHAEASEGDPPAETLSRVNRLLMLNSQKGLFITCLYAIINTLTGDLVYTNAGHNQPLWLRKSRGKVEWLEKGGMPLGVVETLDLSNNIVQVKKGDYLLFYTDGVTDIQSADGTMFGEERLFNLLNVYKDMPYPSLIESVDGKLSEFRGDTPPTDDLTLLSLQRKE